MEIILVRHGKPAFDMGKKFPGKALATELDNYDAAGIAVDSHPPQALCRVIQQSAAIFTSDYRRSLESAESLHPEGEFTSLPLFREAPLPRQVPIPFPLGVAAWVIIARTLWFLGYAGGAESYAQVRHRANEAAQYLMRHVRDIGSIALIGHGLMNILIAKQLVAQGWAAPRKRHNYHWSWAIYRKAENAIGSV